MVTAVWGNQNDTNMIIIGTSNGGIFKTINSGLNWVSVTDNLQFPVIGCNQIMSNPINSNKLFAIMGKTQEYSLDEINNGYLISHDGGDNWILGATTTISGQEIKQIRKLCFHPTNPNIIYGITTSQLICSLDGGVTWELVDMPGDYISLFRILTDIVVSPNYLNNTLSIFIVNDNIYGVGVNVWNGTIDLNVNNSVNWQPISSDIFGPNGQTLDNIVFSNVVGERFYVHSQGVSNSFNNIYVTYDGGVSFTLLISNHDLIGRAEKDELVASINNPNVFYEGVVDAPKRYTHNANSITSISGILNQNGHHSDYRTSHIISVNNKDFILFGNDGGVCKVSN